MRVALFLLLLAPFLFAAECKAGFEETVVVQVIDGMGRALPNASVQVTYQVDSTTSKGYATTLPHITDSNGLTSFTFLNQEVLDERVDCEYTIIAAYDNQKLEKKVRVDQHGPTVDMKLDAYILFVKVMDNNGNVLQGGTISARSMNATTRSDGSATMVLGKGPMNITLRYGNSVLVRSIDFQNDTNYTFQIPLYDLYIYVVNDNGDPLNASLTVDGLPYEVDANGTLVLRKLFTSKPRIKAIYNGVEETLDTDLAVQQTYFVIYDVHAPTILSMELKNDDGRIVLVLNIVDAEDRASGIAPDGIKVEYSTGGKEFVAPVFVKDANLFEAYLVNEDTDGVVELFVDVMDNSGNIKSIRGYFSMKHVTDSGEEPSGGETNGQQGGEGGGISIDPLTIIGIGVGIIVLLIVVNYIREKFGESQ